MNFDVTCYAADDNDYPNESMEDIVFGVKPANPPKPATVTWRHVYAALVTGTQPAPVSDIDRISLAPKVALVYYRDGRRVTHRDAARISELREQVRDWPQQRLGRHSDFVVYTNSKVS